METDFNQELTVKIPRSVLMKLRRQFPGESVECCVEKCAAQLASGLQGSVTLSQETVRELCSTLDVRSVNSEKDILAALRERLQVGPNTVSFDLDPNVAVSVREMADANDEPFSHRVREYIQMALDNGYFEAAYALSGLYFTAAQWKSLKQMMNGKLTAEGVVAAVEHWRRLTASEVTAQR